MDEMCLAFLMYYPRVNFTKCASRDVNAANMFFFKHAWYVPFFFTRLALILNQLQEGLMSAGVIVQVVARKITQCQVYPPKKLKVQLAEY